MTHAWTFSRSTIIGAVVLAGLSAASDPVGRAGGSATQPPGPATWVATWGAAPDSQGPTLSGKTVRQIVRISIGGPRLRLKLSNLFGRGPATIGPVRVALHESGAAVISTSDRAVTFGGRSSVTIEAGHEAVSDPVVLAVPALARVAVTLHVPAGAGPSTIHNTAIQTAYLADGDVTAGIAFPAVDTDDSRYFLAGVEVEAEASRRAVVVLGDSITDGVGSTRDASSRWPDVLAERFQADAAHAATAVVNAGISGNRILNDGRAPFIGPSSLSRFDRDVLDVPGVRWVIVLQGSNDISAADMLPGADDHVSAAQIIDGLQRLIARARARRLAIFGATLLPREGVQRPFVNSSAGRAKRQAVNDWIRHSRAFDGVFDFERIMSDPARPGWLNPAYDSGDHLHPNDAGYAAMARAVDLRLFVPE